RVDRKDYAGPVAVRLERLPPGVTCAGGVVREGEASVHLEGTTAGTAEEGTRAGSLVALGEDRAGGRKAPTLRVPRPPPPPPPDPEPKGNAPRPFVIPTADDVLLAGTFFPGPEGQRAKCVLLLHDIGQHRKEPNLLRLAEALRASGYAVVTFDFR